MPAVAACGRSEEIDRDRNVYVSGTTPGDSIIKFSPDGKFLWDFGHRGPRIPANQVKMDNQQTGVFPPGIGAFDFDEDAREIYIADGFLKAQSPSHKAQVTINFHL
jgi:hypothetical protein